MAPSSCIAKALIGLFCLASLGSFPTLSQAEVIRVGGSGAALGAMHILAGGFMAGQADLRVEVLPSLGTSGGIRALVERATDIALTVRDLTREEKAKNIEEALCMVTAMVFATSKPNAPAITRANVPGLYVNPAPVWPDGQALKLILRSRAGSENTYLIDKLPGMAAALEAAYRRSGMPVGATDQENADLATRTAGSLALTTLLQIRAEGLALHPLALDGVVPSRTTLADSTYPFPLRVCLVTRADPSSAVVSFLNHIKSAPAQAALRALDAIPAE